MSGPTIPGPRPSAARPVLDVTGITLRFGGLTSLDGVSLRQDRGSVLAVIGPNGAGKTSLFNCLTGAYRPQRGSARFWPTGGPADSPTGTPAVDDYGDERYGDERYGDERYGDERYGVRGSTATDRGAVELVGRSPHRVARLGVARTFQNIRLFPEMSALENVQVGVEVRARVGSLRVLFPIRAVRREGREIVDRCHELLEFVGLGHRATHSAASLPYGEQRRLEIARALGTSPSLLLLDEPAAGATAAERRDLVALIRRIADQGISVLLIEHDIRMVAAVAATVVVLNFGRVIATGTPDQIRADPAVVEAYLGEPTSAVGGTGVGGPVPGAGGLGAGGPGVGGPEPEVDGRAPGIGGTGPRWAGGADDGEEG